MSMPLLVVRQLDRALITTRAGQIEGGVAISNDDLKGSTRGVVRDSIVTETTVVFDRAGYTARVYMHVIA